MMISILFKVACLHKTINKLVKFSLYNIYPTLKNMIYKKQNFDRKKTIKTKKVHMLFKSSSGPTLLNTKMAIQEKCTIYN